MARCNTQANDKATTTNNSKTPGTLVSGRYTQEPLYPEGHPKRIEQDSQRTNTDAPSPSKRKKKKNDRTLHASSEPVIDTPKNPNDISIF